MCQVDVIERLYYLPGTTARELSVILNLNISSVEMNIRRLKKSHFVKVSTERGYELTARGKDFAERFCI